MANNVAVLKLNMEEDFERSQDITLKSVVDIRSGPKRPANNPEGVKGSSIVKGTTDLDLRLGLVANDIGKDPLGEAPEAIQKEVPLSYINTVCLPKSKSQFQNYKDLCWVAAWGQDLKRQREVDLPLISTTECERRLGPVFARKGVKNWRMQPSEICAGGIPDKDTCLGEGGAPLVCYDKVKMDHSGLSD